MKKLKKLVAVVLLSLTLFNSIFTSYSITVQAAEALPVTMSALEALLSLFGLELGLGNQSEFFSNSEFSDFVTAVAGGETVTLEPYGEVNFSDGESILAFMTWASALTYSVADGNVMNAAKVLDSTSYKNSGTSATSAMEQKIFNYVGDYNGSSEALAEEVQSTFRVITGGGGSDDEGDEDDDEDDEEVMTPKRWDLFTSVMSTFLFGASEAFNGFIDKLSTPEETEYQDYSSAFDDVSGFVPGASFGKFSYIADPNYSSYSDYYVIGSGSHEHAPLVQFLLGSGYSNSSIFFMYGSDGYIRLYECTDVENFVIEKIKFNLFTVHENGKYYHSSQLYFNPDVSGDFVTCVLYVPLFSDEASAKAYFTEGDTSGIENLVDDSAYPNFRKTAPTAISTLSNTISKWLDTNPAIDNFPAAVSNILDASDPVAGTSEAVPAVNEAIAETAGVDIDTDEDADTDTNTGTSINYMGILGQILAAIKAIASQVWQFFQDPIGAIVQGIQDLIDLLKNLWIKLANYLETIIAAITALGEGNNPNGPINPDGDDNSGGTVNLLNGVLLLIYILFKLLMIFLHLLEFIVNVFKIPATPGFIGDSDFATGFNYIKTVKLSPLDISIYDFLMGLIHITLIFSVVKVLKKHIDKLHV